MPYGTGSVQKRASNYWMIYRDAEGHIVQENTWTMDRDEARRILAVKAIETLEARLRVLEEIVNENTDQAPAKASPKRRRAGAGTKAGDRAGSGARQGNVGGSGGLRVEGRKSGAKGGAR